MTYEAGPFVGVGVPVLVLDGGRIAFVSTLRNSPVWETGVGHQAPRK